MTTGQMRAALRERAKADANQVFYRNTPTAGLESRQMARRRAFKAEKTARKAEVRAAEAEELRIQRAARTVQS